MTQRHPSEPELSDVLARLWAKLNELHRHAGEPSTRELAKRTGGTISHTTVSGVLRCEKTPRWGQLELVVEALGGDLNEFRMLWIEARNVEKPLVPPPRSAEKSAETAPPHDAGAVGQIPVSRRAASAWSETDEHRSREIMEHLLDVGEIAQEMRDPDKLAYVAWRANQILNDLSYLATRADKAGEPTRRTSGGSAT